MVGGFNEVIASVSSTRKRGRPLKSVVRDRLKEMLYIAGELTAYEAHKYYIQLFAKTSQRNIYYQLQKGVEIGMFKIARVEEEKGDFSWGPISKKTYYELADKQGATINESIQEYFQELKANQEKEMLKVNQEKKPLK